MKWLFHILNVVLFLCSFSLFSQELTKTWHGVSLIHPINKNQSIEDIAKIYKTDILAIKTENDLFDGKIGHLKELLIPLSPASKKNQAPYSYYLAEEATYTHKIAKQLNRDEAEIMELNNMLFAYIPEQTLVLIPEALPIRTQNQTRILAFLSAGYYAGNSWDGTNQFNYTINGRLDLRKSYLKGPLKFLTGFNSSLGFQHDVGDYFFKSIDRFEFKSQMDYNFRDDMAPFIFMGFRSQYLNGVFRDFQGDKILTSSLFAPAYLQTSLGWVFYGESYMLDVGLIELKNTYVLNNNVYGNRSEVFGVKKGKKIRRELGLSLRGNITYYKGEKFNINIDLYLFATPDQVDVDFRTNMTYRFGKLFSMRYIVELFYDKEFAEEVQLRNEMQIGITISN